MTKKILVVATAAALISTTGAAAKSHAWRGVVVHRNHHAHTVVVANKHGKMTPVRVRKGWTKFARHVGFRATTLHTGTLAAKSFHDNGAAQTAFVRGAVTFVDDAARTFTVSDNGASVLVHLADTTKTLPAVGDTVLATVDLTTSTASQLEATDLVINPAAAEQRPIKLEGVVLSVDQDKRVVTLSADDEEQSGKMIAVTIPADLDISQFTVGKEAELLATLNSDGQTFTATSVDDHNCGDNNFRDDDQGDNQGEDNNAQGGEDNNAQGQDNTNQGDNSTQGGDTNAQGGDNNGGDNGDNSGSGSGQND